MKSQFLIVSAAALLFAASTASAALTESQLYANRVAPRAESLLRAAGVDAQAHPVSVRALVTPDGHLTRLQILRSSGSPDTDRAVSDVLRKIIVADAPIGLLDGAVILSVGPGAVLEAQAQAQAR